jgi:hypothetical protein
MALERAFARLEQSKVMRHEGGRNVVIGLALISAMSLGLLFWVPLSVATAGTLTATLVMLWAAYAMHHHIAAGNHPLMGH